MNNAATKELSCSRIFIDEDANCGIFSVNSMGTYRVVIARTGKVVVSGPGVNWETTVSALHGKKFDLQGIALLAVITWEHSPTV